MDEHGVTNQPFATFYLFAMFTVLHSLERSSSILLIMHCFQEQVPGSIQHTYLLCWHSHSFNLLKARSHEYTYTSSFKGFFGGVFQVLKKIEYIIWTLLCVIIVPWNSSYRLKDPYWSIIFPWQINVVSLARLHNCFEASINMVTRARTLVQVDPCFRIWCDSLLLFSKF